MNNVYSKYFLILVSVLLINCENKSKTGIKGDNNTNNHIIISEKTTIYNKSKTLNEIPNDILDIIYPDVPIDKFKSLFGIANKSFKNEKYTAYYYNLNNYEVILHTLDNISISSICFQSKHIKPYIKMGKYCPLNYYNRKDTLYLGKSKFYEIYQPSGNIEKGKFIEIGIAKDLPYATENAFVGNPCKYFTIVYGGKLKKRVKISIYNDGKHIGTSLSSNKKEFFFENSEGFAETEEVLNNITTLDFVIIGNSDESIYINHYYGIGIHEQLKYQ